MMKLLGMGIFLLSGSVAIFGQCSEADKKALIAFDKDWTAANQKGERTAIAAFYADEFMTFPNMIDKTAAINNAVAAFERNRANPQAVATTVTDHYQITCSPLTATILHRNTTTPAGGTGQPTYSRSVHFLEKRNGKWVAVSNAGGPLSDSDFLRYMEMDWIQAVKNRDLNWFEKNLANDYTQVDFMNGAVKNKRQAIDDAKNDKTVFDTMEISDLNIRVDGNTAIVTGVGHAKGKLGDGKPFDFKARFTDTYVRRDGRWQAWHAQATQLGN
jgi:ketosteroid isomerase-like protein